MSVFRSHSLRVTVFYKVLSKNIREWPEIAKNIMTQCAWYVDWSTRAHSNTFMPTFIYTELTPAILLILHFCKEQPGSYFQKSCTPHWANDSFNIVLKVTVTRANLSMVDRLIRIVSYLHCWFWITPETDATQRKLWPLVPDSSVALRTSDQRSTE